MALRLPDWKVDPDGTWGVMLRLLRESGRRHAKEYAIAIGFMAFVAITTALSAWIVKDIVNEVFVDRNFDNLILIAGAVMVISLARGFSQYGTAITLGRIGTAIVAETQKRLYDHVLMLGMDYYDKTHSSQFVTRMSLNAGAVRDVLNTIMTSFGRDMLTVIGLVIVMVVQSPLMSLITFVVGPLAILGVGRLVTRMRAVAGLEIQSSAMIISAMQETALGIRVIKAFNLTPAMRARMGASVDEARVRANKIISIRARTSPLMETLGGFAVAGVMVWAGYATVFQGVKPGAFMSFLTAILLAYEPAKRLAKTRVSIERGVVGARMIFEVLDTKPTARQKPDAPDIKIDPGEVAFRKVSFSYKPGTPVLTDFDFRAAPGTVTALVGPSGGGKSTIINLIERFYDVSAGEVLIDGQNINDVRLASLRDQIALVSQETFIFRANIRDNIRFGRPNASDEDVEAAARNALAHDFIMALDDGYDTLLEEGSSQLSGGQRQRIAIARAMIRDARIILLDEATSALDSESEHQVQVAFERLTKGRTTIVIAHRLSTVLGAGRICVLINGEIVESGTHAELLAANRHYARLYRLQFERQAKTDMSTEAAPHVAAAG